VKAWNQASRCHFVDVLWSHAQNSCHLRNFQSLVPLLQHFDEFHGRPAFEEHIRSLQKHLRCKSSRFLRRNLYANTNARIQTQLQLDCRVGGLATQGESDWAEKYKPVTTQSVALILI
jgi:hypothetical protein